MWYARRRGNREEKSLIVEGRGVLVREVVGVRLALDGAMIALG